MIKLLADASLPDLSQFFSEHFHISRYTSVDDLRQSIGDNDVLVCRSTLKVDANLLADSNISCIATVSSGIDHIDHTYTAQRQIPIIDAKGANALAVADYVIACLAWVQERGYLRSMRAGVMGAGAVGSAVAARLGMLGFEVKAYDPPRAQDDAHFLSCELAAVLDCDLICVHVNLHDTAPYPSKHLLNAQSLAQIKPNTVIINASRGDVVDEVALLAAKHPLYYCTDVFTNEPAINPAVVGYAALCTPHIAGHSIEARVHALQMVSHKIHENFGLNMPIIAPSADSLIMQTSHFTSWQAALLSLYNPELETHFLKESKAMMQSFLDLRRAHHSRHHFNCYAWPNMSGFLAAALGVKAPTVILE